MLDERVRLEFILKMINNIEQIVARHNGVVAVLKDEIEARPAVLMAFLQIGETLSKLSPAACFDLDLDIRGAYGVRNFIAHDYMGVDLALIESLIRTTLPDLKAKIFRCLQNAR